MKKLTQEEVEHFLFWDRNMGLLCEYINVKQKLDIICYMCGYNSLEDDWHPMFNNIQQGARCAWCSNKRRREKESFDYEYVNQFLSERNIKLLSKEYKNAHQKLELKCLICGNIWKSMFLNIKNKNSGCPVCGIKKVKQTCLERYGVDNPMKNKEIVQQAAKSQNNSTTLHHWKTRRRNSLCWIF